VDHVGFIRGAANRSARLGFDLEHARHRMTAMTDAAAEPQHSRLAEFPVSFFAIVMGLSGFALATRAAEHAVGLTARFDAFGVSITLSEAIGAAAVASFAVIALFYLTKVVQHGDAVAAEWRHPIRIAFFPAISISLLLISVVLAPDAPRIAGPVWMAGAALQAGLTLAVIASWIGHRPFQHVHLNPAWFIPAVGNVVAPVAGVQLGFGELSWMFFSAGLMFWMVLLTLVFNRLVFHDPLPGRLAPTLMILIAPPAVAFIAWLRLGGEIDPFARILFYLGFVFLGIVATQAGKLARLPFALSWWALSFPVAALTIATLLYAEKTASPAHEAIGLGLWIALAALVLGLAARTVMAIAANEICKPE
jgi:tellurite resistance protein